MISCIPRQGAYSMAKAAMAAATAPKVAPTDRVDAPLAGAVIGADVVLTGAVEDTEPLAAGVVELPTGYGAVLAVAVVAGVVAATADMDGTYGAIDVLREAVELEVAEVAGALEAPVALPPLGEELPHARTSM